MALTKEQRDKLDTDDFAFPRTRQCPMHDATHVKMAWDMVDTTKGVSDDERRAARSRILSRAKKLGVDTKDWTKIKAMAFEISSLDAMALEMPEVEDHPNRAPFSGIMTRVDEPSDIAPHGSYGKRILLPSAVAEAALPSLLGMAIDFKPDLSGHSKRNKIGVITAASVEGSAVHISGFFYSNDFPEEVSMIQQDKKDLGFSFEAERVQVGSFDQDPIRIESLVFTGAAVMKKKSAAYQSTSLAAAAEEKAMEKEQFDALMASIGSVADRVGKVEEKIKSGSLAAMAVDDKVKPHADALHGCADKMEAAGIGGHPTRGHVHILRHMADSMMAEAHQGKIPSEYHAPNMYAAGEVRLGGISAEAQKEIDGIKDAVAGIKTILEDVQKKSVAASAAPTRITLPPRISSLMAKGQITLPDNGGKLTVAQIDAALKSTSLSSQDRLELKIGLERAGILVKAAA